MRSVYFVVDKKYLQAHCADRAALRAASKGLGKEPGDVPIAPATPDAPGAPDAAGARTPEGGPEDRPEDRFVNGVECWVIKTWFLLSRERLSFQPLLVEKAVPGEVCVFHYEHARPCYGVHECFAVVARADRPPPPLADMVVAQNRVSPDGPDKYFIPHWPQHGLVMRDAARGTRLETVAFMGDKKYVPDFFSDATFIAGLKALGVTVLWRSAGEWHNYADVDVVLAMRRLPKVVERTKPAVKLVNAWLAGVPAILTPEAAYGEIRQSPLDYLEADNAADVLDALRYLKDNPAVYSAMVSNGARRAEAFNEPAVLGAWAALLEEALARKEAAGGRCGQWRRLRYLAAKCRTHVWKRLVGWRD